VPANPPPQFPCHCHPLFALVPLGALVLRVDVRERMTALAGCATAKIDAAAATASVATNVRLRRRGRNRCITTPLGENTESGD
jgi:hypothetical protein